MTGRTRGEKLKVDTESGKLRGAFSTNRARCTNVQMLALTSRADRRTGRRWWRRRLHKTDRSQIFHRSPIPEDVPRSRGHRSQGRRNLRRSAWSCSNWSCCSRCHCRTLPRWALWKKKIGVIRRIRKIISYLVFFFFPFMRSFSSFCLTFKNSYFYNNFVVTIT